jgi:hypothetical protein
MTGTRIYLVSSVDGSEHHLVRAALRQHAMRVVQEKRYTVRVASQADMEKHLMAGLRVELASDEPDLDE